MKNTMIILAAVLVITLGGILAFNSSSQLSNNKEGIDNTECTCNCR